MGVIIDISRDTSLGLTVKNLVGFSFEEEYRSFSLPRYAVAGFSTWIEGYRLAMDSEYIFGRFGGLEKKTANIWLLRAGLEKDVGYGFVVRAGIIFPAVVRTSSLGDMTEDIPWPKVGGSLGIGKVFKHVNLDLAVYGDPAKSYVEQQPAVRSEAAMTFRF